MADSAFQDIWSTSEKAALQESYGRVHAKTLAKKLGRSTHAVMHKAARIGLVSRRRWTAENDQELAALWGEISLGHIAKRLKRTVATVYWRARQLGLKRGCPQGLEYLTAAATRTGYDVGQLRVILKEQGVKILPAYARPTGAKRHFHVVDPLDVDDALAQHLQAAPVQQLARDHGVSGACLRFWLLRARAAGFSVPAPPEKRRFYWLVPAALATEVMAWRATQETLSAGAKRLGIDRLTLRHRLERDGYRKPDGKTWWVFKADVDRVAGGARG